MPETSELGGLQQLEALGLLMTKEQRNAIPVGKCEAGEQKMKGQKISSTSTLLDSGTLPSRITLEVLSEISTQIMSNLASRVQN